MSKEELKRPKEFIRVPDKTKIEEIRKAKEKQVQTHEIIRK